MDETTFQLLLGLKTSGTLPDDLSKKQKYVLLRKARNFMIKGELGIFSDSTLKTLAG